MQTLNLKQLEAFCAVVERGSFTAAAEALYLAQSTVSGHILALEKDIGVPLLVRSGKRRITLTEEGRRVYDHAHTILQSCAELSRELEEQTSREVSLAASSIPMQYILPQLISEFHRENPDFRFLLRSGDSAAVHAAVLQGETHIGFVGAVLNTRELTYDCIATDPLVLVTPDDRSLDPDRRLNDAPQQPGIPAQLPERAPFEQLEERPVADDRRLDRLGQPRPELPVGQRREQRRVAHHEARLGKGADHVLVTRDVHAVLAPDRGIDLPQERRRDKPETDAPHVGCRGESRHIGDDAAPHTEDEGLAVGSRRNEPAAELLDRGKGLAALAAPDADRLKGGQQLPVAAVHLVVRNGDHPAFGQQIGQQTGRRTNIDIACTTHAECRLHAFSFLRYQQK